MKMYSKMSVLSGDIILLLIHTSEDILRSDHTAGEQAHTHTHTHTQLVIWLEHNQAWRRQNLTLCWKSKQIQLFFVFFIQEPFVVPFCPIGYSNCDTDGDKTWKLNHVNKYLHELSFSIVPPCECSLLCILCVCVCKRLHAYVYLLESCRNPVSWIILILSQYRHKGMESLQGNSLMVFDSVAFWGSHLCQSPTKGKLPHWQHL